jgi:hypothetical protein
MHPMEAIRRRDSPDAFHLVSVRYICLNHSPGHFHFLPLGLLIEDVV